MIILAPYVYQTGKGLVTDSLLLGYLSVPSPYLFFSRRNYPTEGPEMKNFDIYNSLSESPDKIII